MLPRAQARARKRKGAEPRRPAAQTSGSARGLKRRRRWLISTPRPTPRTPVRQVMSPKMRLSEEEHESPGRQGGVSPRTTRERSRNAGAQRAREPVTKATAVKPREDRTKLGLQTLGGSQTLDATNKHGACISGPKYMASLAAQNIWPD